MPLPDAKGGIPLPRSSATSATKSALLRRTGSSCGGLLSEVNQTSPTWVARV